MRYIAIILVPVLAACGGANLPETGAVPAGAPLTGPSVYALLGQRAELELTSPQIVALDSIGGWLSESNDPLFQTLGRTSRASSIRPENLTPEEKETIDSIRDNNAAAMTRIEQTLTEEQREKVCQRQAQRKESSRNGRNPTPEPSRGPMPGDPGGLREAGLGGWSWCTAPEAV